MTTLSRRDLPEVRLARRHHGVLTRDQLREVGLSEAAIRHRVRSGRLFRVHRGVYAVGRPDLTREGRWLAAVRACRAGALLGLVPAGLLWRIIERGDERPHVIVPGGAGRRGHAGLRVHRSLSLVPGDATERHGIPVTTPSRTLVDLARVLDAKALKRAVRQAERLRLVDLVALRARVAAPTTDVAAARLRRLLANYVPAPLEGDLEEVFHDLCIRHGLPLPEAQVPFGDYRVDFLWPDAGFVVEVDDRTTHETLVARVDDAAKDRYLASLGLEVARYPGVELTRRPAAVAREISAALARRRRALGAKPS
jgi:predicted transcriptional regulator of viral defense system